MRPAQATVLPQWGVPTASMPGGWVTGHQTTALCAVPVSQRPPLSQPGILPPGTCWRQGAHLIGEIEAVMGTCQLQ